MLYVPEAELVRSTVEGHDPEWSDARGYVPSDAVVARVLRHSRRTRPRFRFPTWLERREYADNDNAGPIRAASAVLAATGLAPAPLVVVTVAHLAAFLVIGPWVATQVRSVASANAVQRPAIETITLVFSLNTSTSEPRVAPRPAAIGRATSAPPAPTGGAPSARSPRSDSSSTSPSAQVDTSELPRIRERMNREFLFEGDPLGLRRDDSRALEELLAVMRERPWVRVRVEGAGPSRGERGPTPGAREAETFKRLLIDSGISTDRIEAGSQTDQPRCPAGERRCEGGRPRVHTSLIEPPRE
jgi:hypothetical protein